MASQERDCDEHHQPLQLTQLTANIWGAHILQFTKATVAVSLLLESTPPPQVLNEGE